MSGYIGTQPVPQATQTRDSFTATSGQTSFATGGYTPNFLDVYLNGVKLAAADYTATNGSDVVLASGAATGDILEVVAFTTFNSASSSIDDNGNATAITIDSNENVLVGKTSQSVDTVGGEILPSGIGQFTVDGNFAGRFTRQTSDGDIVVFRKGTGTVGSIGVVSAQPYFVSGNTGIRLSNTNNGIFPAESDGTNRDDAIDLGASTSRFKDLYLSGGVYLGGTGSANKLDDYEEGTWTPVFSDASSGGNPAVANGGKRGFYTKIGNTVHVYCIGSNLVTTGMTGGNDLYIQGLPFTPTSFSSPNQSFVGTARLSDITFTGYVVSQVTDNTTYLRLNEVSSNTGIDSIIVSQLTSASADVILSMTYQTNS